MHHSHPFVSFWSKLRTWFFLAVIRPLCIICYGFLLPLAWFKSLPFDIQVGAFLGYFSGYSLFQGLWESGIGVNNQAYYWISLEGYVRYYLLFQTDLFLHVPDRDGFILPRTVYEHVSDLSTAQNIRAFTHKLILYVVSGICCAIAVAKIVSLAMQWKWPRKVRKPIAQPAREPWRDEPQPVTVKHITKTVYRDAEDKPSPVEHELHALWPVDEDEMLTYLRRGMETSERPIRKD